ncbi:hypothetical protein R80B4_01254 [Fibrobacteres bacterium R8-0-B4]
MREKKVSFKIKVLVQILSVFIVSIMVISFINYMLLASSVETKTQDKMTIFADGILTQIRHLDVILGLTEQTLNENHIEIARLVINMLDNTPGKLSPNKLSRIAKPLDIIELNIADSNGIITSSNIAKYIGFDYKLREVTNVYMKLTDGTATELIEEPRVSVFEGNIAGDINHYIGIARKNGGFVQIGFNANVIGKLQEEINISKTIEETKIGQNGFGMVLSNGFITTRRNGDSSDVSGEAWYKKISSGDGFAWLNMDGKRYYAGYKNKNGSTVVVLVPENDFYQERNSLLFYSITLMLITVVVITAIIYSIVGGLHSHVKYMVTGIGKIAGGNLDARIEGSFIDEFDNIKDAVNSMAADIKRYMDDKLDTERKLTESRISLELSQTHQKELQDYINKLSVANEKLTELSTTDELTKLNNRRSFLEFMDIVWKQNHRLKLPISVLMIDVDYFKKYNDTLGHLEGDKALLAVAQCLKDHAKRETDFVARFGGEEFVCVLPFIEKTEAVGFAKALVAKVEEMKIPHPMSEHSEYLTISVGMAGAVPDDKGSYTQLLDEADKALYAAKESGRNRVAVSQF